MKFKIIAVVAILAISIIPIIDGCFWLDTGKYEKDADKKDYKYRDDKDEDYCSFSETIVQQPIIKYNTKYIDYPKIDDCCNCGYLIKPDIIEKPKYGKYEPPKEPPKCKKCGNIIPYKYNYKEHDSKPYEYESYSGLAYKEKTAPEYKLHYGFKTPPVDEKNYYKYKDIPEERLWACDRPVFELKIKKLIEHDGHKEKYDDKYEEECYDVKYDEKYDENKYYWVKNKYDGKYDDKYDHKYDWNYDEKYDKKYDEKYDKKYDGKYDDKYDKKYDKKYDDKYDKKYDNKYDWNYNDKYDQKYDWKYDDKYDHKYDWNYDEKYDKKYDGKYDEKYDKKYDWKYDGKYDDKSNEKYYEKPGCLKYTDVGYRPKCYHENKFVPREYESYYEHPYGYGDKWNTRVECDGDCKPGKLIIRKCIRKKKGDSHKH